MSQLHTTEQTWVEIDKSALLHNVKTLKKFITKKQQFMAVVKANAYGHGLLQAVSVLESTPVDWYGVFEFSDALLLRRISTKEVLVFCNTSKEFFKTAAEKKIHITISSLDNLEDLVKYTGKKKLYIHLKVDTGLGRQGFTLGMMNSVEVVLKNLPQSVIVAGLYTHFSGTEERKFDQYTKKQYKIFQVWYKLCKNLGFDPYTHAGATSGSIRFKNFALDMARFGIGLYGLWPSHEVKLAARETVLKPVLSWYVRITEVKSLTKGSKIAYDCTRVLKKDSQIALLPIGYYDGLPRALSNSGYVLVNGKKAVILGRVMMNMVVIDVSLCGKVAQGDIATVIGQDHDLSISSELVASLSGTINYDIVTGINPQILRIIV